MILIMQAFIEPHKRYRVGRPAKNIISSTFIYIILYIFDIITSINQNYFIITTPVPPAAPVPRRTRNNRRKLWIARREESSEEKTTLENQPSCWETSHLHPTFGAAPAGRSVSTWEITGHNLETGHNREEERDGIKEDWIGKEKKDGNE